jgi:hypothetical protein
MQFDRDEPWWRTLHLNEHDIWTLNGGPCAVGGVMLIENASRDKFVLVRKADTPGYTYRNLMTLPGGVVRGQPGETFSQSLKRSLLARVESECGLSPESLSDVAYLPHPTPVTGYRSKDQDRRSIVLLARATAAPGSILESRDRTVSSAVWHEYPPRWDEIAPANALILAHACGDRISGLEKSAGRVAIDKALARCNNFSVEVGLPPLAHPWPEANDRSTD